MSRLRNKWWNVLCAVVVATGLIAGGIWFSHTDTFAAATSYQPEQFTELYFSDPSALPAVRRAGATYTVPFTIVNHEGKLVTYTYEVLLANKSTIQTISRKRITIRSGQSAKQAITITSPGSDTQSTLIVQLVHKKQRIQWHLP